MSQELKILADNLNFPEGLRWHQGKLWFSEIHTGRVMRMDHEGQTEDVLSVPNGPSGLGWTQDGDLLIVSMKDNRLLRFDGQSTSEFADLSAYSPGECNDMIVSPSGHAYVGTFTGILDPGNQTLSNLVHISPDGTTSVAASDTNFPNGCVITRNQKHLILAESMANRLTSYNIGADGSLSSPDTWADLGPAIPDGIAIDAEDGVWVTDPMGGQVIRVTKGGDITTRIEVQDPRPVSCALGGPEGRTLYIGATMNFGNAIKDRQTGVIFAIDVDIPAVGW